VRISETDIALIQLHYTQALAMETKMMHRQQKYTAYRRGRTSHKTCSATWNAASSSTVSSYHIKTTLQLS